METKIQYIYMNLYRNEQNNVSLHKHYLVFCFYFIFHHN